jgi:alpha-D-ribose 1-methylphosphonate 5-triphosphate synthase subunit PhnH
MNAPARVLSAGFEEPVFQAQETFRLVMNAMAMPGTVGQLTRPAHAPEPFNAASASFLLTLCDYETPVFLSESFKQNDIEGWASFHAGVPLTDLVSRARFAFVANAGEMPHFTAFAQGTDEYPDRSATIVLQVPSLEGGAKLKLTGPGIKDGSVIQPHGLPERFAAAWAENGALYPRGIDLVVTCGTQLICLPRTTKIREI